MTYRLYIPLPLRDASLVATIKAYLHDIGIDHYILAISSIDEYDNNSIQPVSFFAHIAIPSVTPRQEELLNFKRRHDWFLPENVEPQKRSYYNETEIRTSNQGTVC